ncbi:MAG: heparinase II/III family protein [Candidatus Wallbacteria bacterium]|nr:heparinase II/III family protein [Candidatus Wallbacteria bacterium]
MNSTSALIGSMSDNPMLSLRLSVSMLAAISRIAYYRVVPFCGHLPGIREWRFGSDRKVLEQIRGLERKPVMASDLSALYGMLARKAEPELHATEKSFSTVEPEMRFLPPGSFADREEFLARHRFKWLIEMTESPAVGYRLIEDWLNLEASHCDWLPEDAYSQSERIVNWLWFIGLTGTHDRPGETFFRKLAGSFTRQIYLLLDNLEYHSSLTNNHILNNARCIYCSGALLKMNEISEIGRGMLKSQYDRMISNGVVQEDSSHYQMLITSWMLEALAAAHISGDVRMKDFLSPRIGRAMQVCRALCSEYREAFPLIGDISPDIRPEIFSGLPFCGRGQTFWQQFAERAAADGQALIRNDFTAQVDGNSWLKLCGHCVELWVCAKVRGTQSHGHNDNGSLTVFHKGCPVVLDPGLSRYNKDRSSVRQLGSEGHNTPLLNGIPADPDRRTMLFSGLLHSRFEPLKNDGRELVFLLHYSDGMHSLERSIEIPGHAGLKVVDRIRPGQGGKRCLEKVKYHCTWCLAGEILKIQPGGGKVIVELKNGIRLILSCERSDLQCRPGTMPSSTCYGNMTAVASVEVDCLLREQTGITVEMRFPDE